MNLAVHLGSWTPRAPTSRSWWSLHRHRAVLWQTHVALQAPPPGSSRSAACARGFFRSRGAYLVCFTRLAKVAHRFPSEGSPVRRPSHDQVAFRRIQISRCHVTDFAATSPAEYPPRFFELNWLRLRRTFSPSFCRHPCQRRNGFPRASAHLRGSPCGSPGRATRDASDRRLLPITFTTSTHVSGNSELVSSLRRLTRRDGVSRRRMPLRWTRELSCRAFSSLRAFTRRTSDTSVAPSPLATEERAPSRAPRLRLQGPREKPRALTTRSVVVWEV
jgi:hypothetical protein